MKDRHKSVVDDKSGKIPAMTEVTDWLNQAFEALEAENYSQAETLFGQVLRTAPLHTEALHYLAVCQHKRGDWPATLRNFQQAIASQPAEPDLLHNLFTSG